MDARRLPLDQLTRFHKNARRGDVGMIAESLEANGQYKPIVVNEGTRTGRPFEILAGNHTADAAVKLGWAEIECVVIDVDDAQARKIVLADNRTNDMAGYDDNLLLQLLNESDDLVGTGFDESDIEVLEYLTRTDPPSLDELAEQYGEGGEPDDPAPQTTCPECGHKFDA